MSEGGVLQGILVAHELKERLCPPWLPVSDAPSSHKVLEVRHDSLHVLLSLIHI